MKGVWMCCVFFLTVFLAGCGTVTHVKTVQEGVELDVSDCRKVMVRDFVDGASEKASSKKREEKQEVMKRVVRDFADVIALEIKKLNVFDEVLRDGVLDENTLLIDGTVTRYEAGSPMARLLIGFGAGSSYFDAWVNVKRGPSEELLGTVKVDKNSWVLGGGIAATQTPDDYMKAAATRIAQDLYKAKTGQEWVRERKVSQKDQKK
ncbi:MAG: DUF4410 domain-containing protein [Chlamydiae bacterium]|nr:DUF4410 domain-containing protein [Chlamydiota bacterium]MBI3265658.1 DUF4410 domain-containing protein [Chlamydiota bacterium]